MSLERFSDIDGSGRRALRVWRGRTADGGRELASLASGIGSELEAGLVQALLPLGGAVLGGVVVLLGAGAVGREEHAAPHGEVDEGEEDAAAEDHDAHVLDALLGGQAGLGEEDERGDDGADVAAGAGHAGDDAQGAAGDEGHDAEDGAAGGLHEDGEDEHDDDGAGEDAGAAEDEAEDAAQALDDEARPEAAAHAVAERGHVGEHAAQGARHDVEEAEAGGDEARGVEAEVEAVVVVLRDHVVHGELHAKAVAVGDGEYPAAVVGDRVHQHLGELVGRLLALLLERRVVAVGQVLAEGEREQAHDDVEHAGHEEGQPPRREVLRAHLPDELVQQWHDELRGAAAHVAPPGGGAVGQAHDLGVEHGAHPELAAHEGGQREADAEARHDEARDAVDGCHGEHGRRGGHDEEGAAVARPNQVAHQAHHQSREDGARHGRDPGVADVELVQVQVVTDDRDQRRRRERGREAHEEGEPGDVEGAHVRRRQRQQLQLLRLVLRIHGQRELGCRLVGLLHPGHAQRAHPHPVGPGLLVVLVRH